MTMLSLNRDNNLVYPERETRERVDREPKIGIQAIEKSPLYPAFRRMYTRAQPLGYGTCGFWTVKMCPIHTVSDRPRACIFPVTSTKTKERVSPQRRKVM